MSPSRRPKYVIILFFSSVLFMLTTFVPFFYSMLFPDGDIEQFVSALKGRGEAPIDGDTVLEQVQSTLGLMTKSIHVGSGYQTVTGYHLRDAKAPTKMKVTQQIYLAWFQKIEKPVLVSVALYSNESGQKAYGVSSVAPSSVALQYGFPISIFGVSLFLMWRRTSQEGIPGALQGPVSQRGPIA